ncbi:MAG: PAS domain-containing sensor histidine kinase [Phycisphaerae bacterium]
MAESDDRKTRQEQMVAEMAELAGGLAHELRNPLSTMMINLKLLAEDLSDSDARLVDVRRRALIKVDRLSREAKRLQSLFDEFLRLAGPCRLNLVSVDVNRVVRELVEFVKPMATNAGIPIEFEHDPGSLDCWIDVNLIRQALLNLLINAQQAMPDGGTLTIKTIGTPDHISIQVKDTGVGISAKDQERIMRPFVSTKPDGNGLGLSITRRVVQEHGGELTLQSKLGQGTTATLSIPRKPYSANS